jgi:hypothetical protein
MVGGQRHPPAALSPGKTQYPLYRRLGGPQGRSGRVRVDNLVSTGIRSPDRSARNDGPLAARVEETNGNYPGIAHTLHLVQ